MTTAMIGVLNFLRDIAKRIRLSFVYEDRRARAERACRKASNVFADPVARAGAIYGVVGQHGRIPFAPAAARAFYTVSSRSG